MPKVTQHMSGRSRMQIQICLLQISHIFHLPRPRPVLLISFAFCFRGKFDPQDMDKNVIAIQTVSGILQGPFDLGNQLLGLKGVMEMMVALCGSEREADQLVAVEALIHASTKLSRATFIITNGVSLLKEIYKTTKNEKIKIRTLVVSGLGSRYHARHRDSGMNEAWPLSIRRPRSRGHPDLPHFRPLRSMMICRRL